MSAKLQYKVLPFILVILIIGCTYLFIESRKEYIDNNVLNLSFVKTPSLVDSSNVPDWASFGVVSHFLFRTPLLANSDFTSFTPDLLESYEILDNGHTYRLVFREGQKWSDGTSITPEDFLFSFNSAINAPNTLPFFAEAFRKLQEVKHEGNVITLYLSDSHSAMMRALSQFIITPKHLRDRSSESYTANYWDNPVVSGMYMLSDESNEDYKVLVRNPHFGKTPPKIAEIRLHQKAQAKLDCYITDDIADMIDFRSMRGFTEYKMPTLFYRYLAFNLSTVSGQDNPMQDIHLRRAIASVIDKEYILKNVFLGFGSITDEQSIANASLAPEYQLDIPAQSLKTGLREAISSLEKSSYDLARPLRIAYAYEDQASLLYIQQIARDIEKLGIDVDLIKIDDIASFFAKREFDILAKDLLAMSSLAWYMEYSSHHRMNMLLDSGKYFDTLLTSARQEQEPKAHAKVMHELNLLERENLFRIPILTSNQAVYIDTNKVKVPKNAKLGNPSYITDGMFELWEIKKH